MIKPYAIATFLDPNTMRYVLQRIRLLLLFLGILSCFATMAFRDTPDLVWVTGKTNDEAWQLYELRRTNEEILLDDLERLSFRVLILSVILLIAYMPNEAWLLKNAARRAGIAEDSPVAISYPLPSPKTPLYAGLLALVVLVTVVGISAVAYYLRSQPIGFLS